MQVRRPLDGDPGGPMDLRLRHTMAAGHRLQRPTKCLADVSNRERTDPVDIGRRARCGVDHRAPRRSRGGDPLGHGRRRPDRPRERDLPHERRPRGGCDAGGRGGERRRDGQVARRIVEADPARRRPEQLGSTERDTGPSVEDGRDQLEPTRIESGRLASGRSIRGSDERLHLHGECPPARLGQRDSRSRRGCVRYEQLGGIDLMEPSCPHLEPGRLALGAESVLPRRRGPAGPSEDRRRTS